MSDAVNKWVMVVVFAAAIGSRWFWYDMTAAEQRMIPVGMVLLMTVVVWTRRTEVNDGP